MPVLASVNTRLATLFTPLFSYVLVIKLFLITYSTNLLLNRFHWFGCQLESVRFLGHYRLLFVLFVFLFSELALEAT